MTNRRIGVIGDIHAEDLRLKAAINFLQSQAVDCILSTGDIVDGTGDPNACIATLIEHNVLTVRGNHDRWCLEDKARQVPNAHFKSDLSADSIRFLTDLPKQITVETPAGNLLLCHGIANNDLRKVWPGTERMPIERSKELDTLIADGEVNFVINGHMHFKTIIHFHALTLINAGTITGVRWPGFSLIDFDAGLIEAWRFDEVEISHCKTTELAPGGATFENTQSFQGDWQPQLLFQMTSS